MSAQNLTVIQQASQSILASTGYTREEIEIVKATVAKGTTDAELAMFVRTAMKRGLDPLSKQIHCIIRGTDNNRTMTMQTSIDGFRLIAERTGQYAGQDEAVFTIGEDGRPVSAQVTVYKLLNNQRIPIPATARWTEFAPTGAQAFMWNKMPFHMLAKCAEALALRKGFPQELGGFYTEDEMAQADNRPEMKTVKAISKAEDFKCSESVLLSLQAVTADARGEEITDEEIKALLPNKKSMKQLSDPEAMSFIERLTERIEEARTANRSTEET